MNTRDDVKRFMESADQFVSTKPNPTLMRTRQAMLYNTLIQEEFDELMVELEKGRFAEAAKEITDLIWVLEAYCFTVGIPLDKVFDETSRSNFSKTVDGKLVKREDGKVMKPPTYSPADPYTAIYGSDKDKLFRFTASWCQPCKQLESILDKIDLSDVDYTVVDVDDTQSGDLVRKYGVRSVPTLVRITREGVETKHTGIMTESQILTFLGK